MPYNENIALIDSMVLKIRSLIEDFGDNDFQIFKYYNSSTWTLREPNICEITDVLHNGNPLGSGESYTFNASNNKFTLVGVTLHRGDTIEVDYKFAQYSNKRIIEYIRGALTWLSLFDYSTKTYKMFEESGGIFEIFPDLSEPKDKTGDLICIITSILILPEYNHYRMPNLAINYPEKECREDKIRNIIERYKQGVGIVDIIEWNRSPGL